MARKKGSKQVDSLRHTDRRKNIPTEELRGFVNAGGRAESARLALPLSYVNSP
jgi:hypothetical protein